MTPEVRPGTHTGMAALDFLKDYWDWMRKTPRAAADATQALAFARKNLSNAQKLKLNRLQARMDGIVRSAYGGMTNADPGSLEVFRRNLATKIRDFPDAEDHELLLMAIGRELTRPDTEKTLDDYQFRAGRDQAAEDARNEGKRRDCSC